MTTSQQTQFLSEILGKDAIPEHKLAYFRARLTNRIHDLVLATFVELERDKKITKAELARRIGKKPEQITRWLGAPGNWEIETFSDLMLGMGYEPTLAATQIASMLASHTHIQQLANTAVELPRPLPNIASRAANDSKQSHGLFNQTTAEIDHDAVRRAIA